MIKLKIPGGKDLLLEHLILDFNGTIALDGKLVEGVKERIKEVAREIKVFVVTADTNQTVHKECVELPVEVHVIGKENQIQEKKDFLESLHSKGVVAIGNGVNDQLMFEAADIAIAIIGDEGCAFTSLEKSDIVVKSINHALDLLLKEHRLVATLRK